MCKISSVLEYVKKINLQRQLMFSLYFSQVLIRSRILRENGKYIPKQVRGSFVPLLGEYEHFLFLISQSDNFVDYGFVLVFSYEEVLLQQSRRWLF